MDAVISGRAGKALLLNGDSLKSFDIDDPSKLVSRQQSDLPYLFGETQDLRVIENTDIESIRLELKHDCDFNWALDLTLISLDAELPDDIRKEGIEGLDELLVDSRVVEHLESILYARPLPEDGDLVGALKLCDGTQLLNTLALLQRLEKSQPLIREVSQAWDIIPTKIFGGYDQQTQFQHIAVREGLFRALVLRESPATISMFLLNAGLNESIKQLHNYRQVLQHWANPFRQTGDALKFRHEIEEEVEKEESPRRRHGRRFGIDRRAVLREVNKKKAIITEAMRRRDFERVRELTDDLVNYHQSNSEPEHTAKSLCDLAIGAKDLGMNSLRLELTERSINIAPDDYWSWAQYGDALLSMGRLDDALKAYQQSEDFGAGLLARTGKAEALKAKGELDEALAAFNEVIAAHPEDVVAKCGRAEVLKAKGQLDDALVAFNEVITARPENVFAKCGRAEVLKAKGELDEALAAFNEVIAAHPENVVAKNGRAEVLKAKGQLDDALVAFNEVITARPEDVFAKNGRAEVLKAKGELDEALAAFNEVIAAHPEDVVAKNGRAEVLKAKGELDEALAAFNEVIAAHPENVVAKNGRAEVLKAKGQLDDALVAFNEVITARPENVFAKCGRAEVLKAKGELDEALAAFNEVIAAHPEDVVAKNGRAEVLKELGRLPEALAAYDSTIAAHPENVVAKRGRAELLKALELYDEALAAYNQIIAANPKDTIAINSRSCVLIVLRRYDEAIERLPDKNPVTISDWIGYHIRGMILLRQNKVDEAIRIFEDGVQNDPRPLSKEYFRNALAVAMLKQHDFKRAIRVLEDVSTPLLQPQANVLRLHSFGELGESERASEAYGGLASKPWSIPDDLVDELHRRYILKEEPRHDDEWVFEKEVGTILLVAYQQATFSSSYAY